MKLKVEKRVNSIKALAKEYATSASGRPVWATDFGIDGIGVWASLTIGDQAQIMRFIPAGHFSMGSGNGNTDETPVHEVTITKSFWLGDSEVTQGMWRAVMKNDPYLFTGDSNRPVEMVSWDDSQAFLQKLNGQIRGLQTRLPTEAEWEYACRAETAEDYAANLSTMAWYDQGAKGMTRPVKTKEANAWGLYDMRGNVWEWCSDWYGAYAMEEGRDPTGPSSGSHRVLRGGSWCSNAGRCRSTIRSQATPDSQGSTLGFRFATQAVTGSR